MREISTEKDPRDKVLDTYYNYNDADRYRRYGDETIFGKGEPGIRYDYSDRLTQWDYEKAKAAEKAADQSGATPQTQRWFEAYLSAYYGKPCELKHILKGLNVSNGHSLLIFGYRLADESENQEVAEDEVGEKKLE